MKRPFLILIFCTILPGSVYSQTDTAAAVRDTAASIQEVPAAVPDTIPALREIPAPVADTSAAAPATDISMDPGATWDIVAAGGWTFPYEPVQFIDHFKTNFNVGGGVAYVLPPGEVGYGEVALLFHYYNVLFTRSGFRKANDIPDNVEVYGYPGDIYTGMIQFRGVYGRSTSIIAPFFTVGFGVYHIALPSLGREPWTELYPKYEKTTIGWSVGLGVDVPVMDRITLFVDGKFLLGVTETNGHKLFAAGGGVRYHL